MMTDSFASGRVPVASQSFVDQASLSSTNSQSYSQQRTGDSFYGAPTQSPPPMTAINATPVATIPTHSSTSLNNTTASTVSDQPTRPQSSMMGQESLSELQDILQAYEVLSKKYADEVDIFQQEMNKKSHEKDTILTTLNLEFSKFANQFRELEGLHASINAEIVQIQNSQQNDQQTAQLSQINSHLDATLRQAHSLESLESLKRLSASSSTSSQFASHGMPAFPSNGVFESAPSQRAPNFGQSAPQPTSNQMEEDDMFA